jgi:hypothetical protein
VDKKVFSKLLAHNSLRAKLGRLEYKNSHRLATFLLTQFASGRLFVSWNKQMLVEEGVLEAHSDSKAFVARLMKDDFIRPRVPGVQNFQFYCGGLLEPYVTKLLSEQKDTSLPTKQTQELFRRIEALQLQVRYIASRTIDKDDPPLTEAKIEKFINDTELESKEPAHE